MTTIFASDTADSGEIVRLHDAIVDTEVLDVRDLGKPTSNLAAYAPVPPMWALRNGPATGEYQTYRRLGDAVTETRLQQPGQPRPPRPMPAPGPPPKPAAQVRPDRYRGKRRRPVPAWALALLGFGLCLAFEAAAGAAFAAVLVANGAIR